MQDNKFVSLNLQTGVTSEVADKGEIIIVDELMSNFIHKLNTKGMVTKFCCVGHTVDNKPGSGYITFKADKLVSRYLTAVYNKYIDKLHKRKYIIRLDIGYGESKYSGGYSRMFMHWDWVKDVTYEDKKRFIKKLTKLIKKL